ncbi:atrial natriuretic peptide receptor 1-like isoform X1 [Haliotis rubra]|uniref:atrial natriuretic peptide receptor 1-like isoform X1 n=1 Tax=Haliotis rubra TaxID=36100 RepID=UPI001EE4EE19|nr:atrial natriuretic peptide receptor 1-like isoform X1 [Haliotis rubra]
MLHTVFCLWLCYFSITWAPSPTTYVQLAVIVPDDTQRLFSSHHIAPVLDVVITHVTKRSLLPRVNITVQYGDSKCNSKEAPLKAFDFYRNKKVDIFLGPICDYSLAPVARYAPYWNIPVVSPGGFAHDFGADKHSPDAEYSTLTRVGVTFNSLAVSLIKITRHYKWTRIKVIYEGEGHKDVTPRFCFLAASALVFYSKESKLDYDFHIFLPGIHDTESLLKEEVGVEFNIIVLCASPDSVREIMIKAHELNFDNGEYVFFNIDLFSSKNASERPWFRENDTEDRNKKARLAYEALMTVTLRKPTSPEYRRFSEEVKRRAAQMYKNFTYGEEEVNSFVGAFHDAVILYALALNETLEANGSISDGAAITRRMWNRTFEGITGTVSIDANGDRNADYSLLDLNPESEKYEVVANYYGNRRRYEPVAGKRVYWAGGLDSPPADTPECGFDGSKCPPDEPFPEYGIVIIVLGSVLLVVLIVTFFVYRHIRLEAELAEMNWRVKWEDIMFGAPEKNRKLERQGSRYSLNRRYSYVSDCSRDTIAVQLGDVNRQLFTKTGYFRGAILAIKIIPRQHITIHKPLLLEVKKIKDLQNDHLVRFIGACIDAPHQCILTEYCPKGSLQDVLENDQIKLDWMFRYSIMQDIVRGMAYLHSTDVHSHGNLKSTNCVVDSRFVVKITDFGLHYFRESDDDMAEDTYAFYRSKLWTAPELLRMTNRPPEGSNKGDVYSFAIICQEIVYRNGVFYLQNLDVGPQEILEKLKSGLRPYFRPTIEEFDCPCDELAEVIKRCWAEDPVERPDFQSLKTIIRKLNKEGDKGDILDNLLSRMEQYANNLEALVEERTSDYLEQKKRAEDLLYMMLPRSVANQLVKGQSVAAESYEQVTIYFSDICGFTAMSAESTPMQVIALLNDLYTTFDSIIENFDVYKVETIGDAYMVVSGLPIRNGNLHAREICRMSLSILDAVLSFKIGHMPNRQLKLRIGLHTGSVCAGVVGQKMPRYCLFGDTVNTTSRMESNGLPLKIHVSPQTKEVLDTFHTFKLELRGPVEMKGKGEIITWWLTGEHGR